MITIRAGVITASDRCSRGEREDGSGLLLKSLLEDLPAEVIAYKVLPDDTEILSKELCYLADQMFCDLIMTTGGTGLSPRDHTPEATQGVIEKEIPGISQAICGRSSKNTPFAVLSRGIAGTRGKTLIINFPGSPEAVQEAFAIVKPVLFHALELLQGKVHDCKTAKQSPQGAAKHS